MANPISDFFNKRFIKPIVDNETSRLRKDLNRAKSRLEEKDFELISDITNRFSSGYSSKSKKKWLEIYISWAYANINVIAERVADIHLELFKFKGGGKNPDTLDVVEQHPALDLLLRVNDYQTKWDLIYIWTCHMLAMGEAAWYLVGRNTPESEPTEIWPIRPDYLKIIPGDLSKNEFIKSYEYRVGGKTVIFQPWEILFFKKPHPTNIYRGYGVVEAAMMDINIDIFANTYNETFFENFARPDGVLKTEQKLTDESARRVETGWNAAFRGPGKAGKTAVLEQGLSYESIQPTAKDMDFLEQQKWTRDKLMALFQNTKVILGITEDVNRANAEASELVWIKHNIKPKMQRLIDHLNEFYMPIWDQELILGFDDPLPESVELKQQEYINGVDKWLTRNEIREREGLDPVEGGDNLYVPLTSVPVDSPEGDGVTLPVDEEAPKHFLVLPVSKKKINRNLQKYAKDIQRIKNNKARDKSLTKHINKVLHAVASKTYQNKIKGLKSDGQLGDQTKQQRWELFVKIASAFENQMVTLIKALVKRHEDLTMDLVAKNPPVKSLNTKGIGDLIPDDEGFIKLSIDAITPLLTALAKEQGNDILDFLGSPIQFEANEQVIKALRKFALKASQSYVGTLRERIRKALIEGVKLGEGIEPLQRRLRKVYDGFSIRQSRTIARTETIRASNYATEQGFKQSKVVTGKQWFTALDERVDDECAALDGKIVDIDDDFANLEGVPAIYGDIGFPPIHPNCRCTISPVILQRSAKPLKKAYPKPKPKEVQPQAPDINALVDEKINKVRSQLKEEVKQEVEEEIGNKLDGLVEEIDE